MYQLFPRPDLYIARSGTLNAVVTEHAIGGAPEFMRGLRALFVTDVHVLRRTTQYQLEALARRIAGTTPDMLLLGGDYGDRAEDAARLFEVLSTVKPPLGAFGVIGNNDAEAWSGRLNELRRLMARAGCGMLVNE